jgi:cytochrome c-type biogenesis protein CcmH/NrfG
MTKNNLESKYVKKPAAIAAAIICLGLGFFGGIIFSTYWDGSTKIRKTRVASPATANRPVTQSPSHSQPNSADNKILSLKQDVSVNPKDSHAWALLGHAYFDQDRFSEAIEAYRKHLELNPNNADVWTDLGVMYRRSGNPQEAIHSFDKAAALNPRHRQSRFNKGIVLMFDLKDHKAALECWRELLKIHPDAKTPDGRPLQELIQQYDGN